MKANEVLKLLKVSRPTLTKYVKEGWVKCVKQPNGQYNYDRKSIEGFLNRNYERKIVTYARVSTLKQKQDLINQTELLKSWCFDKGYNLNETYQDVASGISFDKRIDLFKLLNEVIDGKISKVVITYKDRLSRIGFELFKILFMKYGTEIEVISEIGSVKLDSEEIFEEIVSLLHCYSMKLYSNRRKKDVEVICQPVTE